MTEWITGRQLCKRWEMTPGEIIRELGMHAIPLFERHAQGDLLSPLFGKEVPVILQEVPATTYIHCKAIIADAMRRRAEHKKDPELLAKAKSYVWDTLSACLFRLEDIEALERECPWLNPGAAQQPAKQPAGMDENSLRRAALDLKPKIEELWTEILEACKPLKSQDRDDMQETALALFDEAPGKWIPIKRHHLEDGRLYSTAPNNAKTIFGHNLLRLVLEDKGVTVGNSKRLWQSLGVQFHRIP